MARDSCGSPGWQGELAENHLLGAAQEAPFPPHHQSEC